jgi:hypothetical protein
MTRLHVVASGVYRAMDHVAGAIGAKVVIDIEQDIAFEIDFDETRRCNLFVHHPVGIDQEFFMTARHSRGDVVIDEI